MQRPALAPCSRKRGQKAPNWNQRTISSCDGTQRLTSSYNLFIFTKPGKVGLWSRRRSSPRCQWSKEPLHSSSPLEEFSPKIKIVFFCRKKSSFSQPGSQARRRLKECRRTRAQQRTCTEHPSDFNMSFGRKKSMFACATWF